VPVNLARNGAGIVACKITANGVDHGIVNVARKWAGKGKYSFYFLEKNLYLKNSRYRAPHVMALSAMLNMN